MKKMILSIAGAFLLLCCGAAENFSSVLKEGDAAKNKRDYAAAIAAYRKAAGLSKRPNDKYTCAYREQECLYSQKKYDEAIAVLQKALTIEKLAAGDQAEALYLCGRAAQTKKDLAAAEKYYSESGKIKTGWASARSLSTLGNIQLRQKRIAEAEVSFKAASKRIEPGSQIEAYIGLSNVYILNGKSYEEVIAPILEAEKIAAANKRDIHKITVIHYKAAVLARFKKSDEALAEALKIETFKNPQRDWAASIYSTAANVAYSQKKDMKLAKKLIDKAAAQKSSWGLDKNLQKKLSSVK